MNYIEFFTSENKSGIKTRESYLSSNYPEIHSEIKSFIESNKLSGLSFKEEVYYFINNITSKRTCLNCNSNVKFKGTLKKGYGDYCSLTCANDSGDLSRRQKESIISKYGVDSTNKLESVKEKKKRSFISKYGVDNPMKDDSIKKKQKGVLLINHGVSNPMKSENIRDKQSDSVKERYGVSNVFKSELIKDKIKEVNLKNLGVEYPTQSNIIKDKIKGVALGKLLIKYPFINSIDGDVLNCHCNDCDNDYEITRVLLNERNREGFGLCTVCNKVGVNSISGLEKEVLSFIDSLDIECIKNDRKVLGGRELDIFIPGKSIAIEIDGLYWHSEVFKDKEYHLSKTEACEELGIQLIHIFEDEWIDKKEIVKSRLRNILGVTDSIIYARKCEVRDVSVSDNRDFLNNNHIQGTCKSKVKLGLYYNDELVSLMTFGSGRVIMGGKPNEWELLRFCNKINTSVVGGASRLLKHFNKVYNPEEIISYADRRWSMGGMYEKLGFEFTHNSKPNYWYVVGRIREYRFKYRKSQLSGLPNYSDDLSEHEIMLLNKRYRIYDCGSKKYKLIL